MDYLTSMYIDNEMNLDEKKQFVENIRSDSTFYTTTLALLEQEKLLEQAPTMPGTPIEKRWHPPVWSGLIRFIKPMGFAAAGFCLAVWMLFSGFPFLPSAPFQAPDSRLGSNRFVLFEPDVDQVELAGSFTGWKRIAMNRLGSSGYWELILPVSPGEHRYAYILNNDRRIADPTLSAREKDDFGGENSILNMENRI